MIKTYMVTIESEYALFHFTGLSMYAAYRTAGDFIEAGSGDVAYVVNAADYNETHCIRRSLVDKYRKGA